MLELTILHHVVLLHHLHHLADGRRISCLRHADFVAAGIDLLLEPAHHVGQVKIHLVAGAISHQRESVAVADFAAHRRDAHRHFRAAGDLLRPHRAARDLLPPELRRHDPEGEQHEKGQKIKAQFVDWSGENGDGVPYQRSLLRSGCGS